MPPPLFAVHNGVAGRSGPKQYFPGTKERDPRATKLNTTQMQRCADQRDPRKRMRVQIRSQSLKFTKRAGFLELGSGNQSCAIRNVNPKVPICGRRCVAQRQKFRTCYGKRRCSPYLVPCNAQDETGSEPLLKQFQSERLSFRPARHGHDKITRPWGFAHVQKIVKGCE